MVEPRGGLRRELRHQLAGADGAGEHQPVDAPWMAHGKMLRDHAAERGAEHMRAGKTKGCDKAGGVIGQLLDLIFRSTVTGAAGIALVVGQAAPARRKQRNQSVEHAMIGFGAVNQHQRSPRAVLGIERLDSIVGNVRHQANNPCMAFCKCRSGSAGK